MTLLSELQQRLQAAARDDGIDVTDHAAWDAWLGNDGAPTCEERVKRRRLNEALAYAWRS